MPEEIKKTVLVVEDNPLNMKLVVDLLTLRGFDVLRAADGESALKILADKFPKVILLDIQLSGMDGFEVFRRIRADKRYDAIKIIALTALAMNEEREKIVAMGFDAYISKPINTKNFIAEVNKYFEV